MTIQEMMEQVKAAIPEVTELHTTEYGHVTFTITDRGVFQYKDELLAEVAHETQIAAWRGNIQRLMERRRDDPSITYIGRFDDEIMRRAYGSISVEEAAKRVQALVPEITGWAFNPPHYARMHKFVGDSEVGATLSFFLGGVPGMREYRQFLNASGDLVFSGYISEDGVEGVANNIRRAIEERKATA